MFIPVPNATGCLMATVGPMDSVLSVDPDLYGQLQAALGVGGSHTYLRLGSAPYCEYVRVDQVQGALGFIAVSRARNGTGASGFPPTTQVAYELTADAVRDIVEDAVAPTFTLLAEYPIKVRSENHNEFIVSIDPLSLDSNGSIDVTGEWPAIHLAVNPNSSGCCS